MGGMDTVTTLKVTPRLEERINARWLVWHPWALIQARKRLPYIALDLSLGSARQLHRVRYLDAMNHHITERSIIRRALDDPRLHQDEYRIKLEEAIWHRAYHMSSKKGVHRTHKQIREEIMNANPI
jgi:hypothetical protein